MKTCHHFFNGKLYKCGVAKLLPDLLEQKGKTVDKKIKDYKPLEITELSEQSIKDLSNNWIDTCKACSDNPSDWVSKPFETLHKKDIKI